MVHSNVGSSFPVLFILSLIRCLFFFCHFVHLSVFFLNLSLSVLSLLLNYLSSFIIKICLAALSIFALQLYQDVFSFLTFSPVGIIDGGLWPHDKWLPSAEMKRKMNDFIPARSREGMDK